MPSEGPRAPGTAANDAAVGTQSWGAPSNIVLDDGVTAGVDFTNSGTVSQYLKATNFGFSIPTGSRIDGILVEIERRETSSFANVFDSAVRIVKADGSIGTQNKAGASEWPTVLTYQSYGSSSDLWGETWTAEDINDVDFGSVLSATGQNDSTKEAEVDHIRITVYYSDPPQTIETNLLSNPATFFAPGVIQEQLIENNFLDASETYFDPVVAQATYPEFLDAGPAFFEPDVLGAQVVEPEFLDASPTFFGPEVFPLIETEFLGIVSEVFEPAVQPGGVSLEAEFLEVETTLYLHQVIEHFDRTGYIAVAGSRGEVLEPLRESSQYRRRRRR